MEERALPSGVTGPWDLAPLMREASDRFIWWSPYLAGGRLLQAALRVKKAAGTLDRVRAAFSGLNVADEVAKTNSGWRKLMGA